MRWAIIGAYDIDSLEFHLVDSLQFLGHEAKVFDLAIGGSKARKINYWLQRFSDSFDRNLASHIANRIVAYKPDIVVGVYRNIHPLTISIIKKNLPSVVAIHINPDQLTTLEQQQIIASSYDFYFMKDPFMLRFMRNMAGLNAHYLPEAFNPRFHISPLTSFDHQTVDSIQTDVLVFGSMYPYRSRIIEQMVGKGFSIKVFGNQSKYLTPSIAHLFQHRLILGEDKSQQILQAKIVLNCMHYAEVEGVNVKYFEINGIGGFQLCDYKSTLVEYSTISPELYSFSSASQAIDLIHYYLAKPDERNKIRLAQQKHFLSNHTYEHRVQTVLNVVFK